MEEKIINNEYLIDTNEKRIISAEEQVIIESVKRVKDPFKMLKIEDVAKDLGISFSTAYKMFRQKDFPAIKVGSSRRVAYAAYMAWKVRNLEKAVKEDGE